MALITRTEVKLATNQREFGRGNRCTGLGLSIDSYQRVFRDAAAAGFLKGEVLHGRVQQAARSGAEFFLEADRERRTNANYRSFNNLQGVPLNIEIDSPFALEEKGQLLLAKHVQRLEPLEHRCSLGISEITLLNRRFQTLHHRKVGIGQPGRDVFLQYLGLVQIGSMIDKSSAALRGGKRRGRKCHVGCRQHVQYPYCIEKASVY
ncbi:hypothetical protein GBC55_005845 [Pseudomonas sp. TNT3]|nr:hypothetical protein [Pseudomonas sp. TNT3]KAI2693371.1 hypothetical protein GBC55_005845 [Pseudomonas sp. TNT3]